MNTYSIRKPRPFDYAKAFLVSIVVHLCLILVWIGAILLEVFAITPQDFVEETIDESSYVSMPMEMVETLQQSQPQAEPEPPENIPQPAEKSFAPTRPSQETSEEVKSERYFGERSTAAMSEGEVFDEGLAVPTQEGREARTETDVELANSDFADGETEGSPGQAGEPLPPAPDAQTTEPTPEQEAVESEPSEITQPSEATPTFEPIEPTEEVIPTIDERLEMAQKKAAELLELEDSIPVPKEEEKPEPEKEVALEESIPEPKPKPQAAQVSGGASGNRGLDGGYDREASKTRLKGTIRRRGESSLEVEDSVKGRFIAKVNKEIEKAWQRECILRREHILPGVLSVSFAMNEAGKVTAFRFDSRIAGGAIQEGFTMLAIRKAKLPAMPDEIKKDLDGDQLEMNLTFFF